MKDAVQLEVLQKIMQAMRQRDGESLKPKAEAVEIEIEKPHEEPDGDEMGGMGLQEKDEIAPPEDAGAPGKVDGMPKASELSDEELEELVQALKEKAEG